MEKINKEIKIEHPVRLVLVRNFFDQMNNQEVAKIFSDVLQIKKLGYGIKHDRRFLPVGVHDYFSIHLIICDKETLEPILLSKIVSYRDCEYYNITFPLHELKNVIDNELFMSMDEIISHRVNQGFDLSYSGGWTINPKFKGLGLSSTLRDIYTGIHYLIHQNFSLNTMMGFGVPKVGSLEFFKKWGVEPLKTSQGREMAPTPIPFGNYVDSVVAWGDLESLSHYKRAMAEKYKTLWDERIEYLMDVQKSKAA